MAKKQVSVVRRVLNWLGLAIVLVLLLFTLVGVWTYREESQYERTAVPYLRETLPKVAKWDPDVLWELYSEEVRENLDRESHDKIVISMSRLGQLVTLRAPRFVQVRSSTTIRAGAQKFVSYEIPANFENGEASIQVTLEDNDGAFSIRSIHFASMAFL